MSFGSGRHVLTEIIPPKGKDEELTSDNGSQVVKTVCRKTGDLVK